MKILLVSLSNNYDHQLSLYSLYESLTKLGKDVYTIGISNPKLNFPFSEKNIFIDAPVRPNLNFQTLKIWKLKKAKQLIKSNQFDVVYFESLHLWNIFLMNKFKRTKIFHCIHDLMPHKGRNSFFVSLFNKIIFKNSCCVVLRGKSSFDYSKNTKKFSKYNVEYLPLGRRWGEYLHSNNSKDVLFFGRIEDYKGLNNLFEIVSLCKDVKFNIIGKNRIKQNIGLINKLKMSSNVFVDDSYVSEEKMINYFKNSGVVILPYSSSTQSGVIVDSYRLSRPCIAFSVGDIANQIDDSNTGYLVEKDNIEAFIKSIYKFLKLDDEKVSEMCLNSYNFGKEHYSSDVIAPKLLQIFSKYGVK